jgi:MYXO-CTERM domain-containing protein
MKRPHLIAIVLEALLPLAAPLLASAEPTAHAADARPAAHALSTVAADTPARSATPTTMFASASAHGTCHLGSMLLAGLGLATLRRRRHA